MAADICAQGILPDTSDWYHGGIIPSSHESHQPAPPPAPAPLLSRCSSTSSLTSTYSVCSHDSSSTTDSSSPDESYPIIGILKKPKPTTTRRRVSNSKQASSQVDHSSAQEGKSITCNTKCGNESYHDEEHTKGGAQEEDEYSWEEEEDEDDDASECDIIFERHVTFTEPLATDLVSGSPVQPSPHSRTEWTARRARECLERMRLDGGWLGCEIYEDEDDDGEGHDGGRRVQDEENDSEDEDEDEDDDARGERGGSDGKEVGVEDIPLQSAVRGKQTEKTRDVNAGNDSVHHRVQEILALHM
ncbi:hypothetical protein F5B22DRAFT_2378 [Xylaria bambusicola]|uniref:uncharacterized protein n=1 Tax=Xylaria bambusicola TaxID=326684 RepID=UPI00200754B9|nr:uncharacterized protein F5B22DRAFT_2378 [Xylaria bambusicola]KAI0527742.1 hypothetical protein F5B22DRAFT_2378 [Xylaria bambusicola]